MILICKNDIRSRECVTGIPPYILETYTIAYKSKDGELGFCNNYESTEILQKIIKPRSFLWSNGLNEPIEFSNNYKETISRRSSGTWIVFHETNDIFDRELKNYKSAVLKRLKEKIKGGCADIDFGIFGELFKKDVDHIYLGDLPKINQLCRFISIGSYSDAGIIFHLYDDPKFLDNSLEFEYVEELPYE